MRAAHRSLNLAAPAAWVKFRSVIVLMPTGCWSHLLTGYQARAALIGQVRPQPIGRDGDAVAKADQEIDMRQAPHQPGNPAGQGEPAEIDDRFPAADRGEVAEVAVAERRRRPLAGDAGGDDTGDIGALLLGDRRDAGERTVRTLNLSGVANHKDLRVVWEAQIGRHRDAAAAT